MLREVGCPICRGATLSADIQKSGILEARREVLVEGYVQALPQSLALLSRWSSKKSRPRMMHMDRLFDAFPDSVGDGGRAFSRERFHPTARLEERSHGGVGPRDGEAFLRRVVIVVAGHLPIRTVQRNGTAEEGGEEAGQRRSSGRK